MCFSFVQLTGDLDYEAFCVSYPNSSVLAIKTRPTDGQNCPKTVWSWRNKTSHNMLNENKIKYIHTLTTKVYIIFILWLFRMFQKVPLIWMGHLNVHMSDISLYWLLRKNDWPLSLATGFVLLIHIFRIIPQVVRPFNVTESHCNLKSASNGLLRNTWNFKVLFVWRTIFS